MSESTEQAASFQLPEPHEKHKLFEPLVGVFDSKVSMFMTPKPMISTGASVNTWDINQMFLHQDYQSDGQTNSKPDFSGKGYFGYNSAKECYEGFWIDNSTDAMQIETGQVDESGKVWEMNSSHMHPALGGEFQKRSLITVTSSDQHQIEMFHTYPGKEEVLVMKIEYRRR